MSKTPKMNSEAILNRLIHDGYIKIINHEDGEFVFDEYEDDSMFIEDFCSEINKNSPEGNAIALVIQRALFEECKNTELEFLYGVDCYQFTSLLVFLENKQYTKVTQAEKVLFWHTKKWWGYERHSRIPKCTHCRLHQS